ncbi:MAG: GH25 family lysozyme [Eubacteriales bacterium]|nr:GH25 family lysozyme [Eubacteriales bacterium]
MNYRIVIIIICLILLTVSVAICLKGCGAPEPTIDPHEGQVYLYDGYDWTWYTPKDGVPVSTLTKENFSWMENEPVYIGSDFTVKKGFDVSEFQYGIDWSQIPAGKFDFVYLRIGRRGSTEGGLFDDLYFDRNYSGARSRGLETGVYFFSQAVSVSEAVEEANWVLEKLNSGNYRVDLPIVFDWEEQKSEDSRTNGLPGVTVTDCAVAFCETIENAGYDACVYFNRIPGYYTFDVSRLQDFDIWFALPCTPPDVTFPSFYYRFDMWQYSTTAVIPGIPTETDLDYLFVPVTQPAEVSPAEGTAVQQAA